MGQRKFTGVKHNHIHMLIPRTCDHVFLPGRKGFAKEHMLMILEGRLPVGSQHNNKVFINERDSWALVVYV
jgi:hypothetical protein